MSQRQSSISLKALLADLNVGDAIPDGSIHGLVLDARRVEEGDAFVAVQGHARHGLEFVKQARSRGASVVIHDGRYSGSVATDLPLVACQDLPEALPVLAQRRWGDPAQSLDLVAVTGTNGKTSVAWLLAQALGGAMIGTLGVGRPGEHAPGLHTTPDIFTLYAQLSALSQDGVRSVVLEASSHALDQHRLAGLRFTSVIFTTLGHDHLDYHRDRESYARAKARLFRDFDSDRQIINLDDAFGQVLAAELGEGGGRVTVALRRDLDADLRAELLEASSDGLRARLSWPARDRSLEVSAPLLGEVNLYNMMILAAELSARGRSRQDIARTLSTLKPVPGRMQGHRVPDGPLAVIDYAHTPDALESALKSLQALNPDRLWCVFGCGGDRDRTKRPIMGRIAESLADRVVLTNDNPRHEDARSIVRAIQGGMRKPERATIEFDRARAIERALDQAEVGDVVLIAGKGHETDQIVGVTHHPFSDLETVRQWRREGV
jgi:UDP-N-acetylmuramoyl-L-alanyl-D-glutamate--2,6-diaminopimelate ligase